jgi:hypothetical protein
MNIYGKKIKDKPNCIPVGMMRTMFEQSMITTGLMGPEDLGAMEINGNFSHYFKPDVDLIWLGFALGMRCSERMEEACKKIDPPPGTRIITEGRVEKGDWFFIEALQGWSQCPPSSYGEEIDSAIVARPYE